MTWQERADVLRDNLSQENLYKVLKKDYPDMTREQMRVHLKKHVSNKETISIGADGTTSEKVIKGSADQMRKADFLLKEHGFDDGWELVNARSSIWDAQTADGKDTFFSSRITVKPRVEISETEMLSYFKMQAPKYSPVKPRTIVSKRGNMLVVNIVDLHIGQLSWGAESGENYDYKIATQRFKSIIEDVIAKSPYKDYEKIYFVIGNDFFNSDTPAGTTTAGTPQTNDVRPQKMFKKGIDLLVWGIDALRTAFQNSPIETLLVPGNHDTLTSYYAAEYVCAWFRNDMTVTVDISPAKHKGFSHGDTALLFTHGQTELKNLEWVYTEFRHLIGSTKTTEIHAGHMHRIKVEERNGALIRVNPTPAALDAWSYGKGYGSTSQTITRVYSKKGIEYELYSRC